METRLNVKYSVFLVCQHSGAIGFSGYDDPEPSIQEVSAKCACSHQCFSMVRTFVCGFG